MQRKPSKFRYLPQNRLLVAIIITILVSLIIAVSWLSTSLSAVPNPEVAILTIIFTALLLPISLIQALPTERFFAFLDDSILFLSKKIRYSFRNPIFIMCFLLLITATSFTIYLLSPYLSATIQKGNAIYQSTAPDGEMVGISDGTFIFDSNRVDSHFSREAANYLRNKDVASAQTYWNLATSVDSSDAEVQIYQEDQRVLQSRRAYITLVVAVALSGDAEQISTGRDILQGAYIEQKEVNSNVSLPGGNLVRLLIANVGSLSSTSQGVAQQIVQLSKQDKSVVGIVGWPFGAENSINVLNQAHLPVVSVNQASDAFTPLPYYFSVTPSLADEVAAVNSYLKNTIHARKVAVIYDPSDLYSTNLFNDFMAQFPAANNASTGFALTYSSGSATALRDVANRAVQSNADAIFFAGYALDANTLLTNLHSTRSQVPVIGSNVLYQFIHTPAIRNTFNNVYFTAFAYSDVANVCASCHLSSFSEDYRRAFAPTQQTTVNIYIYTQADSEAILAYDATSILLSAADKALSGSNQQLTPETLHSALTGFTQSAPFLGESGKISFGANGLPQGKSVLILQVKSSGIERVS